MDLKITVRKDLISGSENQEVKVVTLNFTNGKEFD